MAELQSAPTTLGGHFDVAGFQQPGMKERFWRYFIEESTALQEEMSKLDSYAVIGGERQDAIDHCLAGISRLSSEAQDAADYIPAHDQMTYSRTIKALTEKLQETRSKFAPKSRFTFKSKNGSAISISDAAELAAARRLTDPRFTSDLASNESSMVTTPANLLTPPTESDTVGDLPVGFPTRNYNQELSKVTGNSIRKPSFSQAKSVSISEHSGLHIILPSSASHATSSGSLTELKRCIVDMSVPSTTGAAFAGLAIKNISQSLIVAGHVAGAAHMTAVTNSVIVVASRQVRIHECKNVDIYLHCASRPIIEDCSNVRFAPIPECYKGAQEKAVENQWDQVDDFKWLKSEHSPNWSILPEEERVLESVWTDVVPGGPNTNCELILKAVGVSKK